MARFAPDFLCNPNLRQSCGSRYSRCHRRGHPAKSSQENGDLAELVDALPRTVQVYQINSHFPDSSLKMVESECEAAVDVFFNRFCNFDIMRAK
jgi:hypothetical protein